MQQRHTAAKMLTSGVIAPQDEHGNEPGWTQPHGVDNALIWGPEGWCEAEDPKHK
jgi:hypothetical protein